MADDTKGANLEGEELERARKKNEAEEGKYQAKRRGEMVDEMREVFATVRDELGLDKHADRYMAAMERQAMALERIARELEQRATNRAAPPASLTPAPSAPPARVHRNVPATIRKHLPPL